ncbi:YdcF family protein [Paenibacillus athensensis]|uniref:DUF218 domain-containing protein n=1 Tax=Paenibacillus athensensis TaxID=1967502 RepID=A0A4Y8Q742_9BACL|nr:YdcF family protein [Paenibacillus athensensis]MCD1257353.1 YdcF family protein [Paenibacillus athensensis]
MADKKTSNRPLADSRRRRYSPGVRSRSGKLRLLLRLAVLAAAAAFAWVLYVQWHVQHPPQPALPEHADVGIVLGASLRHDLPSPGLQERLDLAARLYAEGRYSRLIVSGGLDHNGSKLTEAEGMRNYLQQVGVPADRIELEPEATDTYENLLFSKRIMESRGWSSTIIVTHSFHGWRSLEIARTLGYEEPALATTDSQVLFMPYHEARETLAYGKWQWTKLHYRLGLLPTSMLSVLPGAIRL